MCQLCKWLTIMSVKQPLHTEKYQPYKLKLVQNSVLWRNNSQMGQHSSFFLIHCVLSDEATFCFSGTVNNTTVIIDHSIIPIGWKKSVDSIHRIGEWILGPLFFEDTPNADRNSDFLGFELVPALSMLFPSGLDIPNETIWYQQNKTHKMASPDPRI